MNNTILHTGLSTILLVVLTAIASAADDTALTARQMRTRPPMPWFTVAEVTDEDLRAIYAFVHSLGPAGDPAPAYLPPDREPPPPIVQFP